MLVTLLDNYLNSQVVVFKNQSKAFILVSVFNLKHPE